MKLPNLGSLCCMPRPKMMKISQTLKGRPQNILARGLFPKKKNDEIMGKNEKHKSDENIVGQILRQRNEKFLSTF